MHSAEPKTNPDMRNIHSILIPTEIDFYMREDVKSMIFKICRDIFKDKDININIDDSFIRVLFTCLKIYMEYTKNEVYISVNIADKQDTDCIISYEVIKEIILFLINLKIKFESDGIQITQQHVSHYTGHYIS